MIPLNRVLYETDTTVAICLFSIQSGPPLLTNSIDVGLNSTRPTSSSMCHGFTWIHVLCGHPNLPLTSLLFCQTAILTGQDCLPCIELDWLPLKGFCPGCRKERKRERRHLRKQIARRHTREIQIQIRIQSCKVPDAEIYFQAPSRQRSHRHGSESRYGDRFEADDPRVEFSQGSYDVDLCEVQSKHEAVQNWLYHQEHPSGQILGTSSNEGCLAGTQNLAKVDTRRSCIPVPARRKTDLQTKTRNDHSQIPVPVNRTQKQKQPIQLRTELQVVDARNSRTCVDEMDLFDRITF